MGDRNASMLSKPMAVAIAIRRQKFSRNGRENVFDETQITEDEVDEARAAIKAAKDWDAEYYYEPFNDEPYGSERI
jgi:hypothetical protein